MFKCAAAIPLPIRKGWHENEVRLPVYEMVRGQHDSPVRIFAIQQYLPDAAPGVGVHPGCRLV